MLSALASAALVPARRPGLPERKQAHRAGVEEAEKEEAAGSDSDSCDDVSADAESFMPHTVKKQALPKAFTARGDRIAKGMGVWWLRCRVRGRAHGGAALAGHVCLGSQS